MTPEDRFHLKRLIARMRDLNKSEAKCFCGRLYRLVYDLNLATELDIAEAIVDNARVSYLEVD